MKKRDKKMIREISRVLTEDVIKMIEDMERIQKKHRPKKTKKDWKKDAFVQPYSKKDRKREDSLLQFIEDLSPAEPDYIDISDIRLTPPPF